MPGCPMGCGCRVVISWEFWVMSDGCLKACFGGSHPTSHRHFEPRKQRLKSQSQQFFLQ